MWSLSRDGYRRNVKGLVGTSANSKDIDIGWWSDKYMGSIITLGSIGRSLCEMNR